MAWPSPWPGSKPLGSALLAAAPKGAVTLGLGAIMALWLAIRWTLVPATVAPDDVEPADAVVVFAGSSERLPVAVELMVAAKAPVLVIPNGTRHGWPEANRLCAEAGVAADGRPFEVLCPIPDPVTTRGEARAISALAAERGWRSVVAVTSSYHIARAEMLLERCFAGHVQAVGVDREMPWGSWLRLARHELAGHLAYRLVFRGC